MRVPLECSETGSQFSINFLSDENTLKCEMPNWIAEGRKQSTCGYMWNHRIEWQHQVITIYYQSFLTTTYNFCPAHLSRTCNKIILGKLIWSTIQSKVGGNSFQILRSQNINSFDIWKEKQTSLKYLFHLEILK